MGRKHLLTDAERKERQREAMRRWREANPDYNKKWRKKHKKLVRGYKPAWRAIPENAERERKRRLARKHKEERA